MTDIQNTSFNNPCSVHHNLIKQKIVSFQNYETKVSLLRLTTAVMSIITTLLAWNGLGQVFWIVSAILILIFILMVFLHDNLFRTIRNLTRQLNFTTKSAVICATGCDPKGPDGSNHVPKNHPSAFDLNLFGKSSLFSSLCIARTRHGHQLLAKWLLDVSDVTEIKERADSVKELRDEINLRLQRVGYFPDSPNGIDLEDIIRWGNCQLPVIGLTALIYASFLAFFNLIALVLWVGYGFPLSLFLTGLVFTTGFYGIYYSNLHLIYGPVRRKAEILRLIAESIKLFHEKDWKSPLLKRISKEGGIGSYRSIMSLASTIDRWHARMNQFVAPFAFLALWDFFFARSIIAWHSKNGSRIRSWIQIIAEYECLDSLAHHAFLFPNACFPHVLCSPASFIEAKNLLHPLIPSAKCVVNDVCLSPPLRFILISGSNMSGKSTYMRTIGINAALALAGGPVHASQMSLTPLRIVATMQIQDSLHEGLSRFGAELARLKQIVELSHSPTPILFLLDEIFSGTNSTDRLAGAKGLVSELVSRGGIGMITTHDLALAEIPIEMRNKAANGHFSERMENGVMVFDYKFRPGKVTASNAQEMMRAIGIPLHVAKT